MGDKYTFRFSENSDLGINGVINEMLLLFQCNDPTAAAMIQSDLFRIMVRTQTEKQMQQTTMKLMRLLYRGLRQSGVSCFEIWKHICLDKSI